MAKAGSKLLTWKLTLYNLNLRDPRTFPVRSKIDLLHSLLSSISGLSKSEKIELDRDLEALFTRIETLQKEYIIDLEFKPWALEQRQTFEIEIEAIYRDIEEMAICNDLLDLSLLNVIFADMSHLERNINRGVVNE